MKTPDSPHKSKVLICWSHISGYMAACWKQLAAHPNIELRVIAWAPHSTASFDTSIMDGLSFRLVDSSQRIDCDVVDAEISEFQPDTIIVTGWANSAYNAAIRKLPQHGPRVIMAMDTPWQGSLRQRLTRFRHKAYLQRIDHALVAGERTQQYARHLGFPEACISRGVYGWDEEAFTKSVSPPNARSFIFVGRLVPEKGIADLMQAYTQYRSASTRPWNLTVCGTGQLESLLSCPGVRHLGFVQPQNLPSELRRSTVLILPSHYEPWGVVVAEAMGAGLPVIATTACGAAIDLIRSGWNGRLIATRSSNALANAMLWFEQNADRLPEFSMHAQQAAAPYTSQEWGRRLAELVEPPFTGRAA